MEPENEREYQRREIPKISDYIVSLQVNYLSHMTVKYPMWSPKTVMIAGLDNLIDHAHCPRGKCPVI